MSLVADEPLHERAYRLRREAARLRRGAFGQVDPPLDALRAVEAELAEVERERATAEGGRGVVADNSADDGLLGPETTKLEVRIQLGMEHVPTAIAHLLTAEAMPLVSCTIRNVDAATRRLRVTSFLDGYSASAVDTVELEAQQSHTFRQLPVLRPAAARDVTELTRAALNVLVEDLDRGGSPVELHRSVPVWLLARTSAPLAIQDPVTGEWRDATPFYGAFVTPNAPAVLAFLRTAAECHPEGRLLGYQGDAGSQVAAVFEALAGLTYVDSVLTSSPDAISVIASSKPTSRKRTTSERSDRRAGANATAARCAWIVLAGVWIPRSRRASQFSRSQSCTKVVPVFASPIWMSARWNELTGRRPPAARVPRRRASPRRGRAAPSPTRSRCCGGRVR